MIKHQSSIIDYVREGLDPDIWAIKGEELLLQPEIKSQIIDLTESALDDFDIPPSALKGIYVYGSIMTNQYNKNTDIDCRIWLYRKEMDKLYPGLTGEELFEYLKKQLHGVALEGTDHPLNCTLVIEGEQEALGKTEYDPVYDVLHDKVIQEPVLIDKKFDPEEEFKEERSEAETEMSRLDELLRDVKTKTIDYDVLKEAIASVKDTKELEKRLKSKFNEIQKDIKNLVADYEQIKEDRSEALYSDVKDSPHKLPGNVLYKYLERYKYLDTLKKLKHIFKDGVTHEEIPNVEEALQIEKTGSEDLYIKKLEVQNAPEDVEIWLVDGGLVRNKYYLDFTIGGNDLRYDFIPKGEVWIDDDVAEDELEFVILHELVERAEMLKGKRYEEAHGDANKVEKQVRTKEARFYDTSDLWPVRIIEAADQDYIHESVSMAAEQVANRQVKDEHEVASETVQITLLENVGPEDWDLHVLEGTDISSGLLPTGRILIGDTDRPDAVLSWSTQYNKPFVHNIWVARDMRGKGIARILYDAYRRNVSEHIVSVGPWSPGGYEAAKSLSDEIHTEPPEEWNKKSSKLVGQQREYPEKEIDYTKVPEPIGYVYHVSPYAKDILDQGFIIDPTKTTLGAFGEAQSISTTNYENAVAYRNGIRFVVGMANGELDWPEAFEEAKKLRADDAGIEAALATKMYDEYLDFFNTNYDFYKLLDKVKTDNPTATVQDAVDVRTEFFNTYMPPEFSNYDSIGTYLKSSEGKTWLVQKAINKLDFYNQPVSPEVDLERKWRFTKAMAFYSDLPVVIGYDPPEHLKSRSMDDVGIVEVAVAPVEFSKHSPYRDEEGKGKYTYQIGEQEWRFYDVSDLWPVRIIGSAIDHLKNALQTIRKEGLAFKWQPENVGPKYKGIIEYPGFHTTESFQIAAIYAVGRVHQSYTKSDEDNVHYVTDYPVVVSVDTMGFEPKVDYDAVRTVMDNMKTQLDYFLDELLPEDTDKEIEEKLDQYVESSESQQNEISSEPLDFLSQTIFEHFENPLFYIRDLPNAAKVIRDYQQTGKIPDDVLMKATDQFRYTEDVSEGRIRSVWYVTPVANEMLTYDDAEEKYDSQYPGFDIPGEDAIYGGSWSPTEQLVYEISPAEQLELPGVDQPERRVQYHGTTYKRLLQIAPDLNLPEPPSPPYFG